MNNLVTTTELTADIGETTPVSWSAPSEMTFNEWSRIGRTFQQIGRSLNFWLGDWLNQGEQRYGEMYAQALETTGLPQETLSKFKSVSARVPADLRRENLTWTHHFTVAYAQEHLRGPMLEIAERFDLHTRDLKEILRLRPSQLEKLVETFYDNPQMSYSEFSLLLNRIRLDVPVQGIINATGTYINDEEGADEPEDAQPVEEVMAENEEEETSAPPAPAPERSRLGKLPKAVYLEQIFDFFEGQGVPCTHCLPQEVGWKGLILRATLDEKGRPVLTWETTNATGKVI